MNKGGIVKLKLNGHTVMFFPDRIGELGLIIDKRDQETKIVTSGPGKGSLSFLPRFWRKNWDSHKPENNSVLVMTTKDIKWWRMIDWALINV